MSLGTVARALAGIVLIAAIVGGIWYGRRPAADAPAPPPQQQAALPAVQAAADAPPVDHYQRSLEIFEFKPHQPPGAIPWNKVGLTHISFNVRNTQKWYDYLVGKGIECVTKPERSPRGHTFFFAKDLDGNLIEMIDLGYMHHVLGWLGPLGGWLFRRGMYAKYYG